jgi:Uma2 family endonuclease
MTADEFYEFCNRPENEDRIFELERGEVVEMSRPTIPHGVVCANIAFELRTYVRASKQGMVCGGDAGVRWERDPDTVRGPDVCYFAPAVPFDDLPTKYADFPPRLAVEVRSPNDRWGRLQRRIAQFLRWGTAVVWLVDYEERTVTAYRMKQLHCVYDETEQIDGGDELPGFACPVANFFVTQ